MARPSAADLRRRAVEAERVRPMLHDGPVVTSPTGDAAEGPLHPLAAWKPDGLQLCSHQGEAWFNARRAMMEGFRSQLAAMQAMVSLGQPPAQLERALDYLAGAWRAAYNSLPSSPTPPIARVAVMLADEIEARQSAFFAPRTERSTASVSIFATFVVLKSLGLALYLPPQTEPRAYRYASWSAAELEAFRRVGVTDVQVIAAAGGFVVDPKSLARRRQRRQRPRSHRRR